MQNKIIAYIKTELHGGDTTLDIDPEDDLLGSGLVESMGMMRLIQYVEEEFEVTVEPQDMTIENFMTVAAMVEFIDSRKV